MVTLKLVPGLSGQVLNDIPDQWSATWFRDFCLHFLQYGDVRNANAGTGIVISGNIGTPAATIAVNDELSALQHEPFLLAAAPSDAVLDDYRVIAGEAGVLTTTDTGNLGVLTVGVAVNGIGNTQLRQGTALSVVGNATGVTADLADITASANGQIFAMEGGALTWGTALTGAYSLTPAAAATALTINAAVNELGAQINGGTNTVNAYLLQLASGSAAGKSSGLLIFAGTNASDSALTVEPAAGGAVFLEIFGDGHGVLGASATAGLQWDSSGNVTFTESLIGTGATGGGKGAGTLNAAGLYVNGTAVATGSIPTGANPSASIGLSVVDGSAATFMRSDGAPALSQAIAPTWTESHIFSPASGVGITVNGVNSSYAAKLVGGSTTSESLGLFIQAGTNSSDTALQVINSAATEIYAQIYGDGSGILGYNGSGTTIKWASSGAVTLANTFAINGGTPATKPTGYGTPSGTPTASLSSSSTAAQVAGTLAALLLYLKGIGFLGA